MKCQRILPCGVQSIVRCTISENATVDTSELTLYIKTKHWMQNYLERDVELIQWERTQKRLWAVAAEKAHEAPTFLNALCTWLCTCVLCIFLILLYTLCALETVHSRQGSLGGLSVEGRNSGKILMVTDFSENWLCTLMETYEIGIQITGQSTSFRKVNKIYI